MVVDKQESKEPYKRSFLLAIQAFFFFFFLIEESICYIKWDVHVIFF